jgi:hypothetical protein
MGNGEIGNRIQGAFFGKAGFLIAAASLIGTTSRE